MGFFSTPKRVNKEEFRKVRGHLASFGMTDKEIDRVEEIFRGDMDETNYEQVGIDAKELEKGMEWIKSNRNNHTFSDKEIEYIESSMRRYL